MIIDKIENAVKYLPDNENGQAVAEFIATTDFNSLPAGKHDIYGDAYVNVMEYDTKPVESVALEAHVRYVDLQLIISGSESALYAVKGDQPVITAYDSEKDCAFYGEDSYRTYTVHTGEFALLFPEHLHQFGVALAAPEKVRKAVFKIPVWQR